MLVTLILTVLLSCPLVAAEQASSAQRREWSPQLPLESYVVGADGIATSRGVGRRRSDRLSITRGIPVATVAAPDAAIDDQAIKFTPTRVDLGRMETCTPERYYVAVENRGRVSVRLDAADFTHEGFSLTNDVRGIRLDPGDRFNVQFVFLPRQVESNGVDAHLRVSTTSGLFSLPISSPEVALNRYGVSPIRASVPAGARFEQSLQFVNPTDSTIRITEVFALNSFVYLQLLNGSDWIGPRWPREGDEMKKVAEMIPGQYDKVFEYARRSGRGAWDMPAGTTSPLVKVSVETHTLGEHFTYLHIAAGEQLLLLVPVRITVLEPGIHIEPEEVDLGVLTDVYEDEPHEVLFSLYNAGSNPIEVLELKVLESNLIVGAELRGSTVISPQTRAYHALAVQLRVDGDITGGSCIASLLLQTNASSSELGNQNLRLYGQVVKGHLAFQLNQTLLGVVVPFNHVHGGEREEKGEKSTVNLVSSVSENDSMVVVAGTSRVKELQVWNRFDCPVELQRVWIDDVLLEDYGHREVKVHEFQQGIVPIGESFPMILLQITPISHNQGEFSTSRPYSLMIETNATLHRIQIYVYHGFLTLNATRGFQNYFASFDSDSSTSRQEQEACLRGPEGSPVPIATPRTDSGQVSSDTDAVHICRSLLFDMDRIALHTARSEKVEVTNENPVPQTLSIMKVFTNDTVDMSIAVEVTEAESFSHFPYSTKAAEDGGEWSKGIRFISTGDSIVLPPGYRAIFHVEITVKDTLGEMTVPVMSMTTISEVYHLYARFVSVHGTVEPITPIVVVPAMFPGRTTTIHLGYRNTFEHSVTPLMATTSSSELQLVSMKEAIAPGQVDMVLELLFSPGQGANCNEGLFPVDCLLPESVVEQMYGQLSEYGEHVNKYDVEAQSRRNAFWSNITATEARSIMEAQVSLQTDIIDEVAQVTVKALLERPMVTGMMWNQDTESVSMEFELTEISERNHLYVHVRNPSNMSVHMELAIAETDRDVYFNCEEEFNLYEYLDDVDMEFWNADHVSELCLLEWKVVAASRQKPNAPLFYYPKSIIEVSAGEEAQLGPIYYLPSKVHEVNTTIFVRNDLTHIEPISLFARSGKGTLGIAVNASTDCTSKASCYIARDSATVTEDDKTRQSDALVESDGTLKFALTVDDASTDFVQSAEVVLSNTGSFGLTIRSVAVELDSWMQSEWASDTSPKTSNFVVTSDDFTGGSQEEAKVLAPGETAKFQVSLYASCSTFRMTSWLVIDTSDEFKRIRLEGTITTNAAFVCLRSRMSRFTRFAFRAVWLFASAIAVLCALHTLLFLARDAWASVFGKAQSLQVAGKAVSKAGKASTSATQAKSLQHNLASVDRILADMEQTSFASPARVVTPAVAKLLERRRKGPQTVSTPSPVQSPVQSPRNGQLSKSDEVKKDDRNGNATPLTTKTNTNKEVLPTRDQVAAPSTVVKASLRDAGKKSGKEGKTMISEPLLLSTKSPRQVNTPPAKASHFSNTKKNVAMVKEPSKGYLSSVSPSHSTIAQAKAVDSRHKFSSLSINAFSPPPQPSLGSTLLSPAATSPPVQEEGPFEAFKALSDRWRTETQSDNMTNPSQSVLSGEFPGLDEWNDDLSFVTLGRDLVDSMAGETHHDESVCHSETNRFPGTAGLGFPPFTTPSLPLPTGSTKAPPGFTPADAKPLETRAAFERFRTGCKPAPSVSTAGDHFHGNSLFAAKLPLFAPTLSPSHEDHVRLANAGRIGSGRSKVVKDLNN